MDMLTYVKPNMMRMVMMTFLQNSRILFPKWETEKKKEGKRQLAKQLFNVKFKAIKIIAFFKSILSFRLNFIQPSILFALDPRKAEFKKKSKYISIQKYSLITRYLPDAPFWVQGLVIGIYFIAIWLSYLFFRMGIICFSCKLVILSNLMIRSNFHFHGNIIIKQ